MDQKTVDAISSVMSYLSTPKGSASVIIEDWFWHRISND